MTWIWGLLAAAGLLWPDRIAGPFDGAPLDQKVEAVLVGVVCPALWWFNRRFLTTRFGRACILMLLGWRALSAIAFVQDGWCVRFAPSRPYVKDATGGPHAWDLRADWRSPDPACSAIMTRSYDDFHDFPAWFFNLPPPNESWPEPSDLPPHATAAMTVQGFIRAREAGLLQVDKGGDVTATIRVDGGLPGGEARVPPGVHAVNIDAMLTGDRWQFAPQWNGAPMWSRVTTTVRRPSRMDLAVRPWAKWLPTLLVGSLLCGWIASAIARIANPVLLGWTAIAGLGIGWLATSDHVDAARWAIVGLACAAALPLPSRLRNMSGAFIAVGVPWLVFVVACSLQAIGRFTLYEWGNDFWMFQRFAYRIVMQGYWLEGGSPTFWFQPLYRWIVGLLHLVFGDSSVGEWYWDGACLLAGAMFSFRIVKPFGGFRWAVVAAVAPLGVFVLGTAQYLIGRGLGEITSGGLIYLAALCAMRSRLGHLGWAIAAGALATLGFYTRLNNLPMALGVALFAARNVRVRPFRALSSVAVITCVIAIGVLLFAWRTWYYTGVLSVFYGTQRDLLAIRQPGMTAATVLRRMADSVMMVLTVNDPPRFDAYALPVLVGAGSAALGVVGVPRLRALPIRAVLFFFASIAGAFVSRGSAYAGRFSVHVIPIACALAVCAVPAVLGRYAKKA